MDNRIENPSTGSSASANNPSPNAPSNATFSAPAAAGVPYVSGSRTTDGTPQPAPSTTGATVTNAGKVQIAKTGGIGLATMMGPSQAAALQEKIRQNSLLAPAASSVATPKGAYVSTAQPGRPTHNGTGPRPQPAGPASAQKGPGWNVPNPLLSGGPPGIQLAAVNAVPQQQQFSLSAPVAVQPPPTSTRAPSQPLVLHPAAPQTQQPRDTPQQGVSVTVAPNSNMPQQVKKQKVVLSQEAKSALAKAIWSAIRSPTGQISPDLMQAALATGLPQHAILNAARVAREREAMKRKSMQQQHQQQQQQPAPNNMRVPIQTTSTAAMPRVVKPPIVAAARPVMKSSPLVSKGYNPVVPPKPVVPAPKPKPTASVQQMQAAKLMQVRIEERAKWKRVHHGVFLVQKGKFLAPPNTICGMVRSQSAHSVLRSTQISSARKRPRPELFAEAVKLQQLLRERAAPVPIALLDPDKFKRIKIEPKKFAKALDRVVRKARQTAAEALNKQHKELSKSLVSHQQEFFKFHRQKKADALRLAKSIRDTFDKESKKKEKDAVSAERARLAALKANDMDAYSKLLDETKNDRLKFLMDKTEKQFSHISAGLLQERNRDGSVNSTGGTASYYASAHVKNEEVRQPGILVGGDLKEYQMSGLQWLVSLYNNKLNGILADEMGLGKTIQAISLIAYLMEYKNNLGPYLVIVPLSTLSNWVNEFQKWCPSAHLICYKGTPSQRKELYKEQVKNGHFNVLLTTYEYIIKDKANLRKITWQYAIVDEGHRMKNAASKFAQTLSTQYITKFRLLLTGTPLMNDLSELWALLNFLLPAIFNSVDTFDQWFNRPFEQFGSASNEDEANFLSNEERMFIIHRLHELLRPFMLRRVKSEVLDQLPEKVEKILRCDLSSWQKELYKQISKKAVVENSVLGTGFVQPQQPAARGLNNVVMQLRKVCNHPYLFSPSGYHINESIIRSSGKIELLDRMLPKLRAAGHRVLMFTQMTAVMTILEDYFAYRGYLSLRLDGSTPAEEREKRMYKFNAPDSPYFIFLLSTRAGGLGLNLTAANTVIIFDSDWNPMMDLQAQDRAHRIGQRSDVRVFRLITYSPVEEKILSRATEKLNMSELVVEAGKFDKRSVENDNSLERKKMMEVLLTDFDTNTAKISEDKATSEIAGSEDADEENDDDDDGSEATKEDDLNDLISTNENDYQLYDAMDKERASDLSAVDTSLFTIEEDVPDWIKYPAGKKDAALQDSADPGDGPRKRKEVMYDDGLTEKQFLRMMDKQFDVEASAKDSNKVVRRGPSNSASEPAAAATTTGSDLTDWTFRKLISCTKSVIALKDPSTKRRLCEVFLEKPTPEQFPDYYDLIKKPMAINDILRKCRGKLYPDLQEFRDDWKIMFANAKKFNGEGSWVVEDGKALDKELDRILKKNGFSEDAPKQKPSPPKPPKKKLRIKLSLKTLKAKEAAAPPEEIVQEEPDPEPIVETSSRGRKKKRKVR